MTNTTDAARTLASRLRARNIAIKHVQALDLLAAGAGLANRHVLATLPSLPLLQRVNVALLTSAASVLARHDLTRRQTLVDETSEVLVPKTSDDPGRAFLEEALRYLQPHMPDPDDDDYRESGCHIDLWLSQANDALATGEDIEQVVEFGVSAILTIEHKLEAEDPLNDWLERAGNWSRRNEIMNLGKGLKISALEFEDVDAFLQTPRGAEFVKSLCANLYYERYTRYQNDGPMSLKQGNQIAEAIIEAKTGAAPEEVAGLVEDAIEEFFNHGYSVSSYWYNEGRSEVESALRAIADSMETVCPHVELDEDEWIDALEDPITQHLSDDDDSTARDLLGSYDRCEAIFLLKPEGYAIDQMVSSNRPWADFADLHVGPELQHALSSLGYSIDDYRLISGNRNPAEDLVRGLKKRQPPLVTPGELQEIVENACAQNFLFAVYGVVSVTDLIDLDLNKPITFSQAAIATYNPYSGTFMEVSSKPNVTVTPKEGELRSGAMGVSPDDVCGLYLPHFYASLSNEPASAKEKKQHVTA